MKSHPYRFVRPVAGAFAVLALSLVAAAGGDPNPRDWQERANRLEREARELKEEGKHDEAQRVMREVLELRAGAERRENVRGAEGRPERQLQELVRERERALEALKNLRAEGNDEEAARVKERILEMENQIGRLERASARGPREPGPGRGRPPGPEEERKRMEHLRVAVENLRAAGMPEAAQRLERQAQARPGGPPPMGMGDRGQAPMPMGEMRQTRAELQELRRAVRELRAQVESLKAEMGRR